MAKTTAPLLSFGSRGQIGQTQVYSSWKGRSYARRYTVPSNPNSAAQQLTRNSFAWLMQVYKVAPALVTASWELYAKGKVLTSRNAFIRFNNSTLRTATDLDIFVLSPGALGGLPPATITLTPGAGELTVAATVPAVLPVDWSVTAVELAIIRDQNPQSGVLYNITAAEDVSSPYSNTFTGLAAAVWQGFAWVKWERPDGAVAWSPSIQDKATVT